MSFVLKIDQALKEYGNCPCIVDQEGTRTLTYREFDELSLKVSKKLKSLGISEGDSVIVSIGRSREYIVAEYGILRMGAVAIPIIPSYPEARVEFIKKDADVKLVIKEDFFEDLDNYQVNEDEATADCYGVSPKEGEDPKRMILYTSGSTGNPKGVIYRDKALCGTVERNISDFLVKLSPYSYGASGTMSFTVTITEYYRNFILGACVHIISEETRKDIIKIQDYYADNDIVIGFLSPRMVKIYKNKDKALKMIGTGSERVVNTYSSEYMITNGYGQTETIGGFCTFRIDKPYENTPVGKPQKGVSIVIADENNNELPQGAEGFIIAIGNFPYEYNNLPEQSAKTFNKLDNGLIAVHTGDRGKILEDGNLLFVNRNDWMIKVHGQRVEPGEIEAVMNETPGVTASVVKGFELEDGSMLLCGFYTGDAVKEDILKKVEEKLPHYMVPSMLVKYDKFPVNPNGKIDRLAIKKPDLSINKVEYVAPQNEMEEKVCKAMETVLEIDRIGRNDDFYLLGGNSINAVLLIAECDIKGLSAQHIMIGKTPKGIIEKYKEMGSSIRPEMIKADSHKKIFPMTNAQKYQLNECDKINSPMDLNDFRGFWKLNKDIDIEKLKKAVLDSFSESEGMNVSFDREKKLMIRTDRKPHMEDISLSKEEFEKFRKDKNKVVRDILNDELYELAIIYTEDVYLYININHLLYDESSLKNLFGEIINRYEGKAFVKEETDIFDLASYEESVKDSQYYKDAVSFEESIYEKVSKENIPPKDEKQDSGFLKRIAPELSRETVEEFLKKNGVSEITFLQTAFALALSNTIIKSDKLTYMVVYDGRIDPSYRNIKGVLAQSVYMYADIDKNKSVSELLNDVQTTYQKLLYFGCTDSVIMSSKYPNIKNDIYLNFRGSVTMDLTLDGKTCKYEDIGVSFEGVHVWTRLNFLVDYTEDKHYVAIAAAGYNDRAMICEVIDEFERMVTGLINAQNVSELLKG